MRPLVLDSEAMNQLARTQSENPAHPGRVLAALRAVVNASTDVLVPAAVLAELYRGGGHDARVDACLGRHKQIGVVDTDRALAKLIGHLLTHASRTSKDHVDAAVVATALTTGGALILTSDPSDLTALAAEYSAVVIEKV